MKVRQAIKLVLKENTTFDLYFKDGVVKRYDILSLANDFPQLNALKDRKLFLKGHLLGWGTVVWNDELDVSCDVVYEEGVDVSNEYNDIELVVLGFLIKEKRLKKNLTQIDLSKIAMVNQADLSRIEKGLMNPSIKVINKICRALDTKLSISIK